MASFPLSDQQLALVRRPVEGRIFLEGPAGAGKTTAGVERLLHLLDAGVPADSMLLIVPQRTLTTPYYDALRRPTVRAGGHVTISTVGGLAQRMEDLFWPMIAEEAGFAHPDRPPTFLTLETAQYYMARIVRPLLDRGYFETVVIDRNRLYSQIIDDLNKAAVVGFPHTEIGRRLKAAWGGEPSQLRIYEEAQACASRFRAYCLAHNLLDFSLQIEVFLKYLWPGGPASSVYGGAEASVADGSVDRAEAGMLCRDYLLKTYAHLIVENVEEDTPVAHDVLREWLPHCRSALVIYDREAGYRRFLGADPEGAYALKDLCEEQVAFTASYVISPDLQAFGAHLARSLDRAPGPDRARGGDWEGGRPREGLSFAFHRYHPQMLDWVAEEIARLVHDAGVPPGEIVVLAPFLTDALRFSLMNRLEQREVPARSHRPSRALREEPATRCLLTLSAIAHPGWGICPSRFDVAHALMQAIEGMDLVRAQLLADIVYRVREGRPSLDSFDQINPHMQARLTFVLGQRYEGLRTWIQDYVGSPGAARRPTTERSANRAQVSTLAFDHFLSRLFGEVLAQEGYGFHRDYDAGETAANLIESVRKFRWATEPVRAAETGGDFGDAADTAIPMAHRASDSVSADAADRRRSGSMSADALSMSADADGEGIPLGREYLEMVQDGVIAAQYILGWRLQPADAVLLAPAYTFLMNNQPVDYQFWLNVGGRGWWERLYQPLTHPYVLSRHWPPDGGESSSHQPPRGEGEVEGAIWTDAHEVEVRQEALYRLTQGLIHRCRHKIYLGLSHLGEQGNEQKGPLLQAIQRVLRHYPSSQGHHSSSRGGE